MAIPRQRIRLPDTAWRSALRSLFRGDLWEGPDIARFERAFADAVGATDAVAVPSGRAGFRFLIEGLQLPSGGQVICSAFGYPIVPFVVKSLGYELKFVDCEMQTLGINPEALAASISDRTQAVIATHLYGVPCQINEIAELSNVHGSALIEDCAHCFGASVGTRKVGTFGDAGCFSFETSKVINTMGGGMVTVRDKTLGARIREAGSRESRNGMHWLTRRLFRTSFEAAVTNPLLFNSGVYQALRLAATRQDSADRFASGYQGDEVSMAGKMGRYTNYQARLGLKQMLTAAGVNARRTANAERLIGQLRDRVKFQEPAGPDVSANFMLVTALVPRMHEVSARLLRAGVDTKHLYMRDCSRMFDDRQKFPNAARAEKEALHLPAHPQLSTGQIDAIAAKVAAVVTELGIARSD
ncbi:MAG: DegT/DnrJ/EryC1/StrS family aminotransferase [Woeseia sp.]